MLSWLTIVGMGEDGFAGLGRASRRALLNAPYIVGGARHISLLPRQIAARATPWPRPFSIDGVLAKRGEPVCVIASGDPMLYGVGATLTRDLDPAEFTVLPGVSSLSLAAARMGWALQDVEVVSLVGRPLASLSRVLHDRARILVLSGDGGTPAAVAALLRETGLCASRISVLANLGGAKEHRLDASAAQWDSQPNAQAVAPLNVIAITCSTSGDHKVLDRDLDPNVDKSVDKDVESSDPPKGRSNAVENRRAEDAQTRHTLRHPGAQRSAGFSDEAYEHDGQLTKRDIRAIVLARLAPCAGEVLWDVGAGSGSIGIEWMRAHPHCQTIAIEANASRQQFILRNRERFGVPSLALVCGAAPQALAGLPQPDAIFIGGGVTVPGVLEACWQALPAGGRLVANAVTLQSEMCLIEWRARHGGTLSRFSVAHAAPLAKFDTWRQALPVTLLEARKPALDSDGRGFES